MKLIQKITAMLLLLTGMQCLAQTGVTVTYYDGTSQQFNVTAAGKLYFEADSLLIKDEGTATPTTIPVSIIRRITFSEELSTVTFGDHASRIVLYPNPGSEVIRIKADASNDLHTKIYSLTGQLILSGTFRSEQVIDVSALAPGLYLAQVNGVTIKFSKK